MSGLPACRAGLVAQPLNDPVHGELAGPGLLLVVALDQARGGAETDQRVGLRPPPRPSLPGVTVLAGERRGRVGRLRLLLLAPQLTHQNGIRYFIVQLKRIVLGNHDSGPESIWVKFCFFNRPLFAFPGLC